MTKQDAAFFVRDGRGRYRAATADEITAHCADIIGARMVGKAITSPAQSADMLTTAYGAATSEQFGAVFLDNRHRVIAHKVLFCGTIDSTTVYPREVVKTALGLNAAAVILFHNHPSGVPEPSEADRLITLRIRDALNLVDVRLLDHFVIGGQQSVSLAARGLL